MPHYHALFVAHTYVLLKSCGALVKRRLGEMLTAQQDHGELNTGAAGPGRGNKNAVVAGDRVFNAPKLADAGISKTCQPCAEADRSARGKD